MQLNSFAEQANWDGGCIQLIYAGHGCKGNGALVLADGNVTSEDFLQNIATFTNADEHRRRIDVILDSCFSGAFITTMLADALNNHPSTIFPCSLFSATLHDEFAWEYHKYGHGIWTSAFSQQLNTPSLNTNRLLLISKVLWRRIIKDEYKELYNGGVSYMTADKQHSFFYENGYFQVDGAGSFELPESDIISAIELQRMLKKSIEQDA